MRTTIDLSNELYTHLRTLAAERGTSIKSLIHDAVRRMMNESPEAAADTSVDFPLIRSKRPGTVLLEAAMIHDSEIPG